MTSTRDLGVVTIRRVEMTMALVDLFRSERPSDGIPRLYGMEGATTGPYRASREQRDLHPLKSLDSRDCCGETRGDGPTGSPRYIGGAPKGRGGAVSQSNQRQWPRCRVTSAISLATRWVPQTSKHRVSVSYVFVYRIPPFPPGYRRSPKHAPFAGCCEIAL